MDNLFLASLISLFCLSSSTGFNSSVLEPSATQLDCYDMEIMCREDYTSVCHDAIMLKAVELGDTATEGESIVEFLSGLPEIVGKHCSHRQKRSIKGTIKSFFAKIAAKFTRATICRVIIKVNDLLKSASPNGKAACALDIIQAMFCTGEIETYAPKSEFAEHYLMLSDRISEAKVDNNIEKSPEFQRLLKSYLKTNAQSEDGGAIQNSGPVSVAASPGIIITMFVMLGAVLIDFLSARV